MSKDDSAITNRVLLDHIQAMKGELKQDISSLDKKIDNAKIELKRDMEKMETRLVKEMNRLHDETSQDIAAIIQSADSLEARVENIEIREIPAIKQHVGIG